MLKLATLIENPGEPEVQTRYQDPAELKALGYNGLVIYESTALSGVKNLDSITSDELRRWVGARADHISQTIHHAQAAGLSVYLSYDALVLPTHEVDRNVTGLCCKGKPTTLCPASDQALELSVAALDAMLHRWPSIDGIVFRFGDTDAQRLPHLVGNDIYSPHCPRCSQFGRAERALAFIQRMHRLVVEGHNKRLIVRAWNVRPNGMHDVPELAGRIAADLPGDPKDDRLVLSFKFTQTDFWRYQRWNPSSLVCGDRPIIYELQCQREFEGKGGVPNWQAPLWRDGCPEMSQLDGEVHGLAEAAGRVNLVGLWAWVRGGGWGGPFVKNEQWIDANVYAVPHLADDPKADTHKLAEQWARDRLGLDDDSAGHLVRLMEDSPAFIRQAFYIGPFAAGRANPWHPNADWVQDDLLDTYAAWRIIQKLNDTQLDELIQEKEAAAEAIGRHRAALQQAAGDRRHRELQPLVNSLLYAESFFEALRDLVSGLVSYRRYQKSGEGALADVVRQKLFAAQDHWNHHTQRFGSLPGAATAFRENNFWDVTQDILGKIDE
ncbi:MAG: hypothetical protein R3C45_09935 [Phycisphaerales bacterium]